MIMLLLLVAALLLAIAAYAQRRIPSYTASAAGIVVSRAVLIVMGLAFGYVATFGYEGSRAVIAFLIGFGAVHFPAAFILFVKSRRDSGRT